jgi:chromosome segregation ATPase
MRVLLMIAFLLAPLSSLMAQSQGASAQKEKEKAKPAAKKPAPTYTDDDLKKARESAQGNVTFLSSPAGGTSASSGGGDGEGRGDGEEEPSLDAQRDSWRERADERRQAVAAAESAVKALEDRLAELTNDMSANPGDLFDPSRLQKREAEKQELLPKLEGAKAALAAERKALAAFEQEAREKSIPPGWLQPKP